jgi:hypothetical protein
MQKKHMRLFLAFSLVCSLGSVTLFADAKQGQKFYLKKLKSSCKKAGLKSGAMFAVKHDRRGWQKLKESGELKAEWQEICPKATKKIKRMKEKDVKNLYDFVWKYASDGEQPSCG